jgi:hypothetical protein
MTIDINGYMNDLVDDYTNTTCDCAACKAVDKKELKELPARDWNTYDSADADSDHIALFVEDLMESADEVLENLEFLGEGTNTRDVLSAILGLEATLSLIKRYLLDRES